MLNPSFGRRIFQREASSPESGQQVSTARLLHYFPLKKDAVDGQKWRGWHNDLLVTSKDDRECAPKEIPESAGLCIRTINVETVSDKVTPNLLGFSDRRDSPDSFWRN
jgi:hypothetical protein